MVKLKVLLLVSVVCSMCILADGIPFFGRRHDRFFKKLSDSEKRALMSLAISHYFVPEDADGTVILPDPDVPIRPNSEEIPKTLFATMMNGGVPDKWMREFIKWLRDEYKMTDESFKAFAYDEGPNEQLCRGSNSTDCVPLEILKITCCPFG